MDSDGSNIIQLTNNPVNDGSPRWSPDGEFIAFITKDMGVNRVFVLWPIDNRIIPVTPTSFDVQQISNWAQ
jgi:Tol biopolymer transport system component